MKTVYVSADMPYSTDFLEQIADDIRQLAVDYEKATGDTQGAGKLLKAYDVINKIRIGQDDWKLDNQNTGS